MPMLCASWIVACTIAASTGIGGHPPDERAVDLDLPDRQRLEVGERGEAGAEVVERESQAELAELREHVADAHGIGEDHVLGDLQHERLRRQPVRGQRRGDLRGELRVLQIGDRGVHGDVKIEAFVAPHPHLCERELEHPARQRPAQPRLLGDGHELAPARSARAWDGCQRTSASTPTILRVPASALGWKWASISPVLQRVREFPGERETLERVLVALARVARVPGLRGLGLVHRDVGVLHQLLVVLGVLGEQRDPDACRHAQAHALDRERLGDRLEDLLRHQLRARRSSQGSESSTPNSSPPRRAAVSVARSTVAQPFAHLAAAAGRRRRGRACR